MAHHVTIHTDGTVRVAHAGDDNAQQALGALNLAGDAGVLGAAVQEQPSFDPQQGYLDQAATNFGAQASNSQDLRQIDPHAFADSENDKRRTELLKAAAWIASGLVAHGKTRRRNPAYIADTSLSIAQELVSKVDDLI